MFTEKMSEKYEVGRKKSTHNNYPQTRYTGTAVDRSSCTGGGGSHVSLHFIHGKSLGDHDSIDHLVDSENHRQKSFTMTC